jgi:hypothetical protein
MRLKIMLNIGLDLLKKSILIIVFCVFYFRELKFYSVFNAEWSHQFYDAISIGNYLPTFQKCLFLNWLACH